MPRIKLAKDMEGAESVRYVMQFLGMPGSGDPVIKMEDADYLKVSLSFCWCWILLCDTFLSRSSSDS